MSRQARSGSCLLHTRDTYVTPSPSGRLACSFFPNNPPDDRVILPKIGDTPRSIARLSSSATLPISVRAPVRSVYDELIRRSPARVNASKPPATQFGEVAPDRS